MGYVGFLLLMVGAAGMDSNAWLGGSMALVGVVMMAVTDRRGHY